MLLLIPFGLIGDYIGTIPCTIELARQCRMRGDTLFVCMHYDARPIFEMIPASHGIRHADWKGDGSPHLDIRQIDLAKTANTYGRDLYMARAYYGAVGLPIPMLDPPVDLDLTVYPGEGALAFEDAHFDYGLAPFARSLGDHERWPREKWQALVDAMPDKQFVLYGSASDDPNFVLGDNVTAMMGEPLKAVARHMQTLSHGLISVSTGLSHLAYATKTKNYLLINQVPFAKNPRAKAIDNMTVRDIPLDRVLALVQS